MKKNYSLIDIFITIMMYFLLGIISLIVIFPVIWIVSASLRPGTSIFGTDIFPKSITFSHYVELFSTDYPRWYMNTLLIATINMIVSVIITTLTAYIFSRYKFKGKKQTMITVLILQMFPSFLAMTAIYSFLKRLNLVDTYLGLLLVYVAGQIPYNAWLAKGYFDGIPGSLDEAARVDGAGPLRTFFQIIIPVAKPILVFIALVNFTAPWFDFIFPKLILRSAEKKTLAVGLFEWISGMNNSNFTLFAAGAILVAIPITLLFVFLQKNIVEGLSSGASKE
ncbi:MAG: sugar ABC transporter permease [Fusobacteriaceae bacterium]|nr:sugar ABC transporter permease [Fusobacteriaceae bacterium]MBU9918159.1 sugar ABC transporter permease [Fusobacteriaceae bacterium]